MFSRQQCEYAFHRIDPCKVTADLLVPAVLAVEQFEPAPDMRIARCGAAKMDERSEFLLLPNRSGSHVVTLKNARHVVIQIGRRELDGMRGYDTGVEAVEPARMPGIPSSILNHGVVVDAKAPGLRKRSVRNLIHAHGARCWPV